ncbi:YetF domain-containing protein [Sporolactobacillus spathodeae]
METIITRTLFLMVLIGLGFRQMLAAKMSDRPFSEWLILAAAAEFSVLAVIEPDVPLTFFFVPILLLILAHRFFAWFQKLTGKWPQMSLVPLTLAADELLSKNLNADEPIPVMGLVLIENGKIRSDNLRRIERTQLWLRQELRKFGYRDIRQVNYLTMDQTGNFFMDLKKEGNP